MSEKDGCNVLRRNDTYIQMGRGWEGIPDGLMFDILTTAALLIGFLFIQWRVRVRKVQLSEDERETNWLQFIFGDKKEKETDLIKTKTINRKNSMAYLPKVLHEYEYAMNDKIVIEEFEEEVKDDTITIRTSGSDFDPMDKVLNSEIPKNMIKKSIREDNKESETTDTNSKDGDKKDDVLNTTDISIDINTTHDKNIPKADQQKSELLVKSINKDEKIKPISEHKKKRKTGNNWLRDHWIHDYLSIKDEDILKYKGSDALQYLIFQRYIIYFLLALTFICLTVILPANLQGSAEGLHRPFGSTTINNLQKHSKLLWFHAIMASFMVMIGMYIMIQFSKIIEVSEGRYAKRVLLIEGIPEQYRKSEVLVKHFKEFFPKVVIKHINFVYDIRDLVSLKNKLSISISAKKFCLEYKQMYDRRCEVRPYYLGRFGGILGCCLFCPKLDGLQFYEKEKTELEEKIAKEVIKTLSKPKGIVFIKFSNKDMTEEVFEYFKRKRLYISNCCYRYINWFTHLFRHKNYDPLKVYQWRVYRAPYPEDISWNDIGIEHKISWLWNIGMHLILIVIFIFLTTPAVILKIVENIIAVNQEDNEEEDGEEVIRERNQLLKYMPSLTLMIMTSVLPTLVTQALNQIPHRTKSALNHSIMQKVYLFLILMVLILPSLGIMSTGVLIQTLFSSNSSETLKWNCLFPSQSSAFFVNYVLASGFISNTFEFMRFSELAVYILCTLFISRSVAEHESARQFISFEFFFGSKYPRFLLMFTIITTYSIACPLIAPCGLFYMVYKHLVDRYCIFYVYTPSKINSNIHSSALFYVHISLICLIFQVTTFLYVRSGALGPSLLTQLVLDLLIITLCCRKCFSAAKKSYLKTNELN